MRPIRASEIGSFVYCKRAWWYQRRGFASSNVEELTAGSELHYEHGRSVLISGFLRMLGYGLLLAAVVVFVIYATNLIL